MRSLTRNLAGLALIAALASGTLGEEKRYDIILDYQKGTNNTTIALYYDLGIPELNSMREKGNKKAAELWNSYTNLMINAGFKLEKIRWIKYGGKSLSGGFIKDLEEKTKEIANFFRETREEKRKKIEEEAVKRMREKEAAENAKK